MGVCIFLAAIVWAAFGQALWHGFINYDDGDYITDNPEVSRGLTLKGIVWAFTHVHSSNWHPLTWVSHMMDCQLYGLNPGGHHLTNILFHMTMAILLFLVLRQITSLRTVHGGASAPPADALWRSAFVAAVFAVHPLRVESVAWVSERKDILAGILFMLTIWAYGKHVSGAKRMPTTPNSENQKPKSENLVADVKPARSSTFGFRNSAIGFYCLAMVFFALGLMCKPMLVTLPLVLLLLDYWPLRRYAFDDLRFAIRPFRFPLWPRLREKIPFFGLAAASGVVTLLAQQEAMKPMPLSLRIGNALVSYVAYLVQMFWPSDLALSYPSLPGDAGILKVVLSVVLLAFISVVVFVLRRHRYLVTGWLWYLIMLVPVIGILQVGNQARADRYTYLPQIGLYLLLTWAAAELCAGWRHRRLVLGGCSITVIAALILCARVQVSYWRNSEALWAHAIACNPENSVAHSNLGSALLQNGDVDEAVIHLRESLRITPGFWKAHNHLGYALLQKGSVDEAIIHFQEALKKKPNDVEAHNNLGTAFVQKGSLDEAIFHFQRALQARSDYADIPNNLGYALLKKGQVDLAIPCFLKALQIKPDFAVAYNNLGNAYVAKGNVTEAITQYQAALKIDSGDPQAHNNLGKALLQKGSVDEAITHCRKALEIVPDYAEARVNLGNALIQKGSLDEAIGNYQEALQTMPGTAEVHCRLGNAFLQKGKEGEARVHYQKALEIESDYPEAQNGLAWVLATSSQASLRDGVKAVELAERARRLIGGEHPIVYRTLAAAYAEAGRFEDARVSMEKAIQLAQALGRQDMVAPLRDELKRYEAGLPLHQGRP